jgi:hypothetical protein
VSVSLAAVGLEIDRATVDRGGTIVIPTCHVRVGTRRARPPRRGNSISIRAVDHSRSKRSRSGDASRYADNVARVEIQIESTESGGGGTGTGPPPKSSGSAS